MSDYVDKSLENSKADSEYYLSTLADTIRKGDLNEARRLLGQYYENAIKVKREEGVSFGTVQLDKSKDFQRFSPMIAALKMFDHYMPIKEDNSEKWNENGMKIDHASILLSESQESQIIAMLQLLLENGFSINRRDDSGATALMKAVRLNSNAIVDYLLNAGADASIRDLDEVSVIMASCQVRNSNLVRRLLFSGDFDVNQKDAHENTLLHYACGEGLLDIVKQLLNMSANIEDMNDRGETPLFSACRRAHLHIIEYLILRGANVVHLNFDGETAIVVASKLGYPIISATLRGAWKRSEYAQTSRWKEHNTIERGNEFIMRRIESIECNQMILQQLLLSGATSEDSIEGVLPRPSLNESLNSASMESVVPNNHISNNDKIEKVTTRNIITHNDLKRFVEGNDNRKLPEVNEAQNENNSVKLQVENIQKQIDSSLQKKETKPILNEDDAANDIWNEMVDEIEGIGAAVQIREFYERIGMIPKEFM